MKKTIKIIAATVALLLAQKPFAKAQSYSADSSKYYRSGYIIVGAGAGIPTGAFQGTSWTLFGTKSGFARTGFACAADFAMPVAHSNFGFAVTTGYYNNPMDAGAVNNAHDVYTGTRGYFNVSETHYKTYDFMGGLYVTLPMRKVSFDFKAVAGMGICYYPAPTISVIYSGSNPQSNTIDIPSTTAFAYGGNATARYSISKHICAFAQVGFMSTTQGYSTILTVFDEQHPVKQSNPETIVNVSAGAGWQF